MLFSPRPIIENVNTSRIVRIQYNPNLNGVMDELIKVEEYDEKRILTYLSNFNERRTLNKVTTGYWMGHVKIEIIIDTEDGLKSIILGNDHYSYECYRKPKYEILDSKSVISELLDLINTQATS